MKKNIVLLTILLVLALSLTACNPEKQITLSKEDQTIITAYLSRAVSAAGAATIFNEPHKIPKRFAFTTGTTIITTTTNTTTVTFQNAVMTSETNAIECSISITDDMQYSFENLVLYHGTTKYVLSGTAESFDMSKASSTSIPYLANLTKLEIDGVSYSPTTLLISVARDDT